MFLNLQKRYVALLLVLIFLVAGTCFAGEGKKIDINTASKTQLMELNRIGPKYADRIIEHRQKKGKFEKPQDIIKVKGIGKKTWEANKDRIVVSQPAKK